MTHTEVTGTPTRNNLIVRESTKQQTEEGLYLPERSGEAVHRAEVVRMGPEVDLPCDEGDIIYYSARSGLDWKGDHALLEDEDVLVVED